jgi:hypothetical protein
MVAAMPTSTSPVTALNLEWLATGTSRSARAALAQWAAADPMVFAGLDSPADVVTCCHGTDDSDRGRRVLRAVLARADADQIAARTVLQVVMPGLVQTAADFFRIHPGRCQVLWRGELDELLREVVSLAAERIGVAASSPPEWPAQQIIDQVRRRLRMQFDRHDRDSCRTGPLAAECDREAGPTRTAADLIGSTICAAVEAGVISARHATVLYGLEVLGFSHNELAERMGSTALATRQVRHRGGVALARAMADSRSTLRSAA